MTLTKSDLLEISKIVKNEVDPLKTDLSGVKTELSGVKTELSDVKSDLSGVKTELQDVKQSVKKIEKNVETMLGFLDEQDVKLHKRVSKIEKHLNLPQN
jgi:chromosome segregation ATPase